MTQEFIPYEQALELKKLGFDEQFFAFYLADTLFTSNDIIYNSTDIPVIKAPLYHQAFRWFREKYELSSWIYNSNLEKGVVSVEAENLLWKPEIQESKISQFGGHNIRYKHDLKAGYIQEWTELHDKIIPWNTIRYIF